jgi:pyruvate/2-oxoglutarate/acetoin dehydrogenase E1 component
VTPATVTDAKGMLLSALNEPDPVFIFEHAFLYPLDGELDERALPVDLTHAAVRRPGRDVSLITFGGSLWKALDAANQLAQDGIDAEVVDLRVLRPLDAPTVLASVRKTHRALVLDEGWRTGSFAAEVSAQIMEGAFYDLDAPVARLCSAEVPIPYPKHLEDAAIPQVAGIVKTVHTVMGRKEG